MTDEEILNTAFRVWGDDFYQVASLTSVAEALGVTKPALYRHFPSKDALLKAMFDAHLARFAGSVKTEYERCRLIENERERELALARIFAAYFLRGKHDFIFCITQIYGSEESRLEWTRRSAALGVDFGGIFPLEDRVRGGGYPPRDQLVTATAFFMLCFYYKKSARPQSREDGREAGDAVISVFLDTIERQIRRGLGLARPLFRAEDFSRLEKAVLSAELPREEETAREKMLQVVAQAVSEAGPWHVSMEMVAKKIGLSKSSLYSYYSSKAEMIENYILTEIQRVSDYAEQCTLLSALPEEQIYLAIIGIANYLRSKPDVLNTIDKLRMQKPDMKKHNHFHKPKPISQIYRIFSHVKTPDGARMLNERDTEWILFLIVNILLRRPVDIAYEDMPNESFRILYQFVCGGIEH